MITPVEETMRAVDWYKETGEDRGVAWSKFQHTRWPDHALRLKFLDRLTTADLFWGFSDGVYVTD